MADVQISELTQLSSPSADDLLLIRHDGVDSKIKYSSIKNDITAITNLNSDYTFTSNVDSSNSNNSVNIFKYGKLVIVNAQVQIINDANSITNNKVMFVNGYPPYSNKLFRGLSCKIGAVDASTNRYCSISSDSSININALKDCVGKLMLVSLVYLTSA